MQMMTTWNKDLHIDKERTNSISVMISNLILFSTC